MGAYYRAVWTSNPYQKREEMDAYRAIKEACVGYSDVSGTKHVPPRAFTPVLLPVDAVRTREEAEKLVQALQDKLQGEEFTLVEADDGEYQTVNWPNDNE